MDRSPEQRRLLRAYRFLLRCYTPRFRRTFGAEMTAVFGEQMAHAASRGRLPLLTLLGREYAALFSSGLRQRLYASKRRAAHLSDADPERTPMPSFLKNESVWRVTALILLLIALTGPWAYDLIHVPAQYRCNAPFLRLQGDFCGRSISLLSQFNAIYASPVIFILPFFTLPIFTVLPLLRRPGNAQVRKRNTVAWALSAIAAAIFLTLSILGGAYPPPWGLLLYLVVTLTTLLLERLPPPQGRRPRHA